MQRIIEQLAEKHQLPKGVVKEAVESMIKYTKQVMINNELEGIMLPAFGKFVIKPGKKKWIKTYRRIRKELDRIEHEQTSRDHKWLDEQDTSRV
jgi:nucleoid DNA-binding protein